jgi:hypothetical protein
MTAEMYAETLRREGVPVTVNQAVIGEAWSPNLGPTEIWLEDASLLEDPGAVERIRVVLPLEPVVVVDEDEDFIVGETVEIIDMDD